MLVFLSATCFCPFPFILLSLPFLWEIPYPSFVTLLPASCSCQHINGFWDGSTLFLLTTCLSVCSFFSPCLHFSANKCHLQGVTCSSELFLPQGILISHGFTHVIFVSFLLWCCSSLMGGKYLLVCVRVHMLSCLSRVRLFVTLWTVALQAPLSMGILQARILEWVAIPISRGSSWPRDRTHVSYISCIGRWVLYH